jgi:flagellar biosynthesis protein FliP
MGVIEVVLSKNDPSTVRAAVASGLVYLLFLGTAPALLLLYCCFTAVLLLFNGC